MKHPRVITAFEFTGAMVEAGIITPELRNLMSRCEIIVDPRDAVHFKFEILADERLYELADPVKAKEAARHAEMEEIAGWAEEVSPRAEELAGLQEAAAQTDAEAGEAGEVSGSSGWIPSQNGAGVGEAGEATDDNQ